jgi:hypothetical protein
VAAALIALVIVAGTGIIALASPSAHTTSITATGPAPIRPPEPTEVPATLTEVWRAPSGATTTPVVAGPVVVTGDGSTVIGRDALSGAQRWLYRRNLPLCTVGAGWNMALAVFRNGAYCSEVTGLRGDSGTRGPQRNTDVPPGTQLLWDGNLVTATGWNHLETWRSDLVKTLEYGMPRARIEPETQPRPNCRHTSVAVTSGLVGVLEQCPHEPGNRLTVLRPDNADSDSPDEELSTVLPSTDARLVALCSDHEAVLLPDPTRLSIRDSNGNEVASYPLTLPASDATGVSSRAAPPARGAPAEPAPGHAAPGEVAPTTSIPGAILWWTGSSTIALDADDLHPVWTLPGALGPGTLLADQPVVPVPNAELVVSPANGAVLRTIPVDRGGYQGPVATTALGPVLLEQRGTTVVALR